MALDVSLCDAFA
ncbi:hypothetical protein EEJ33_16775 [Vibrio cholerae]|nr:hypothetical protein EEJ33_16775 [Vibrio cholerae]